VRNVRAGSPASRAGILQLYRIRTVDGTTIGNLPHVSAQALINGIVGKPVRVEAEDIAGKRSIETIQPTNPYCGARTVVRGFSLAYSHNTGLQVASIQPNSPAYLRGLRSGDRITRLNNLAIPLTSLDQILQELSKSSVTLSALHASGSDLAIELKAD
jgi:C-terminal processing protease CtpA/Prc